MILSRSKEKGEIYAWFAIFMAALAPFLLVMTIDLPRLGYVRVHLQAASDAGCQAAADTLNVPLFQFTGQYEIDAGRMSGQANSVFYSTLRDAGQINFSASLSVHRLDVQTVECVASASVIPLLPVTPNLNTHVYTVSQMRVTKQQP
jgi:hypothetical protein